MIGIKQTIKQEIDAYAKLIERYNREIKDMPAGSLSMARRGSCVYLHHNFAGRTVHLSPKKYWDCKTAQALRRKRFLTKSLRVFNHDIKVLRRALSDLIGYDPLSISENLPPAYQLVPSREVEAFPGFDPKPASYYNYRSKSEEIIALTLEANGLMFAYEMEIIANGRHYRPDFTILHPVEKILVYWEHFGLLDDPKYYNDNTQRILDYHVENIVYGRNFIFTTETLAEPLDIGYVQSVIDHFFFQ